MNIAAVTAALELDLDPTARLAVIALAVRAHRGDDAVEASALELAGTLNMDYLPTWRALRRAVDAGALSVDKDGRRLVWRLTTSRQREESSRQREESSRVRDVRSRWREESSRRRDRIKGIKRSDIEKDDGASARRRHPAALAPLVDNPPSVAPVPPLGALNGVAAARTALASAAATPAAATPRRRDTTGG